MRERALTAVADATARAERALDGKAESAGASVAEAGEAALSAVEAARAQTQDAAERFSADARAAIDRNYRGTVTNFDPGANAETVARSLTAYLERVGAPKTADARSGEQIP